MSKQLYRATVLVEYPNCAPKWLKYRNISKASFFAFLDRVHPDWRYANLYEAEINKATGKYEYAGRTYNRRHPNDSSNKVK